MDIGTINIRELKKEEYNFLEEMLFMAVYVHEDEEPYPKSVIYIPEVYKYINNFGERKYDIAFVAVDEKKLIGCIWGRVFDENEKGYAYIDNQTPEISLAVLSQYRNKGLGEKLIDTIANYYNKEGFKRISLSTDKRNRSKNLYYRKGFQIEKENDVDYIMIKNIT